MSEIVHSNHEKHESLDLSEEILEKRREQAEKAGNAQHEHQKELDEIHKRIEQSAVSGKEVRLGTAERADEHPYYTNRELKAGAFERTLRTARKHLSKPEKALSKVIHQQTVDSVSRIGEKTVARPSGILGGSLVAFLGSATLLYVDKHYGYRYNFLVFLLLFVGGYIVGMIIELLLSALSRKDR